MKVIITGSTGMVGHAAVIECLENAQVEQVMVINRRPIALQHPKLKEALLGDYSEIDSIRDQLAGYDACFHCMGVSAMGLSEEEYTKITFDHTKGLADQLYQLNPQSVFIYVSGTGTDSTEQGSLMWARVKGKTENYILNKGFNDAYAFRPGMILPEKGVKTKVRMYQILYTLLRPFYPLFRRMNSVTTSSILGRAMIQVVLHPQDQKVLENSEINRTGKQLNS
ncbi:MAG: NAD(P)H-binding protein [Saprospiraceae bacterium]